MINMGECDHNIASIRSGEIDKSDWNIWETPAASSGHYAIHEISGFFVLYMMNDWWWTDDDPIDITLIVMWYYDSLSVWQLIFVVLSM